MGHVAVKGEFGFEVLLELAAAKELKEEASHDGS